VTGQARHGVAWVAMVTALASLCGCGEPAREVGNGAAMDGNLSAKADQMEADANRRANAMANDMMSRTQITPADNASDGNGD